MPTPKPKEPIPRKAPPPWEPPKEPDDPNPRIDEPLEEPDDAS